MTVLRMIGALAVASLVGCGVGTDLSGGVNTRGITNVAQMTDESWDLGLNGETPAQILVDQDGLHHQSGGPHLSLGHVTPDGTKMFLVDARDTDFDLFETVIEYDEQGNVTSRSTRITGFGGLASQVEASKIESRIAQYEASGQIDAQATERFRAAFEATGSIAEAVAAALSPGP